MSSTDSTLLTPPTRPYAKPFSCPNCGATITLRTPGRTLVAACDSCGSLVDTTDETYQIISQHMEQARLEPVIPLGQRGKLRGTVWEVIGVIEREDCADISFTWHEYLLFNPRQGYRWLVLNMGHWSLVTMTKKRAEMDAMHVPEKKRRAQFDGRSYRFFYLGSGQVSYVAGEFYWQLRVGERALLQDFISPPYMLSLEKTDDEIVWSVGEYIEAKEIEAAFQLEKGQLPKPQGVAPNQVWSKLSQFQWVRALWIIFVIFLVAVQFLFVDNGQVEAPFSQTYRVEQNKEQEPITTPSFDLKAGLATTQIQVKSQVNNSSLSIEGELVNEKTGAVYPFNKLIEYYHGVDGGESWSEGETSGEITLSSIPGGPYHMNLDLFEDASTPTTQWRPGPYKEVEISLRHHVPTHTNFLWILIIISLLPAGFWLAKNGFESQRWENSSIQPAESSDDE
jgi:predicted RNA-binding Zn-ribbon protein involved in translation (DUF1610 family)